MTYIVSWGGYAEYEFSTLEEAQAFADYWNQSRTCILNQNQ